MRARGLAATGRAALRSAGTAILLLVPGLAFAQAPAVTTGAASEITPSSATLNGTVTTISGGGLFDYGETVAYGQQSSYISFGMVWINQPVSAAITNLTCGTTYHYRLVGWNGSGTTYGDDETFTTLACAGVSGVVTSAATGLPLEAVTVTVYDPVTGRYASAVTDATGAYLASGPLPTGSYVVSTWNELGHVDEVYDDKPCTGGYCDYQHGTPVAVAVGSTTTGVDFALSPTAGISGVVTDAATGLPIVNIYVQALTPALEDAGSARTDATGAYTISGKIPTGTYTVAAFGHVGNSYIGEVFDDHPCDVHVECPYNSADPVAATSGSTTAGVNFALSRGGRIRGRITDAQTGDPIPSVSVEVYTTTGAQVVRSYGSDANGYYQAEGHLVTGSYLLVTSDGSGHINRVYGGSPCVGIVCDVLSGTPVSVTVGTTTDGIDFVLQRGGSISGTVTDAQTGDPIFSGGVAVEIYDALGRKVESYDTNTEGYATNVGLPAGSYYARTVKNDFHIDELYDNIRCVAGACSPTDGTPIAVGLGAVTTGIDFALDRSGEIRGVVTGPQAKSYLDGVLVLVHDAQGALRFTLTTDKYGEYSQQINLPPGTYFVRTSGATGYVDELYDDIPCPGGACTVTDGTPVIVTAGSATTVSFALAQVGGRISGTVTDAGTSLPLAGVTVKVWHDEGGFLASAVTGADGAYLVERIPAGYRYVTTESAAHRDELYDGLPCEPSCGVAGGTALVLSNGQTITGVDFALELSVGKIAGQVSSIEGPLEGITVRVFDADGLVAASQSTGADGTYLAAVPPGTYHVATVDSEAYLDELYDDTPCALGDCVVASGTPVTVVADQTRSGTSFVLAESVPVEGTVDDDKTSEGIPGITVTVHDDEGTAVATAKTDDQGVYRIRAVLPAGRYFLATSNALGYVDEVYDDQVCHLGTCAVASGTAVAVTVGGTVSGVDFGLALAGSFYTLSPCRLVDTRNPSLGGGAPLAAASETTFVLAGRCAVPDGVTALAINVTAIGPTASGHLRLFPADRPRPTVSAVNYSAGQTRANNAVMALSPDGRLTVYVGQSAGTVHVVVDVSGYVR